ncbi:RagB/SusD family nutrient uptake outer membrane protein [Sunxiuqinia sp. A32]|uniref:RagB/SusD family nutrient uptake outer membrane protein n=1 Tax=Sunxiuqinia sp. A32 TaxID=3461496 RepID=UPI0040460FEC
MKSLVKIIIVTLILASHYSCNDLTETVYSELTEDGYNYTPDEIYSVAGPVYQNLRSLHTHTGFSIMQETTTDVLVMPANASGWDDGGIFKKMHLHTWNAEAPQVKNLWAALYPGVLHANRIIEQLEEEIVPVPSDLNKEALIAEMKVARAFYYWLLIDNFGDVPFVMTTSQELPSITTREEIFQSIVNDITTSLSSLSEENSTLMYGRFNKWAAKTLLANLYLNAEVYTGTSEWDKCISECNDIISSGKYDLEGNYIDCFKPHNENSVETIFAIPYDEINGGGFFSTNYTFHASSRYKYNLSTTPWGAGSAKAVSQFIDTYDMDDSRLDDTWEHGLQFAADGVTPLLCTYDRAGEQLNYSKDLPNGIYTTEDEGYRIKKFLPEEGAQFYMNNDFPFFRYAQVLMMKAECLLRNGQADDAATIVTQVRQRAFKDMPAKATVSGTQLTANSKYSFGYVENYEIVDNGDTSPVEFGGFYDELGYEFACEWQRRRDMIRFGTYTIKSWLSHKPQGEKTKVFPLPQTVVDANPNLEQNPDYK